jgi:SAM-dependent methyltransferase
MLARAAERLPPGAPVKFVRADATTYLFETAFDLLFSRFGVMFFAEPARAFANLRTALKPSGRLAFPCWRKFNENPWLQVPLRTSSAAAATWARTSRPLLLCQRTARAPHSCGRRISIGYA